MPSSPSLNIPYGAHNITEDDIDAIVSVLRSKFLTQGDIVPQFESALSRVTNSQYTVAANSATSALHLACRSLGLESGDVLWTSPITFVASSNCALFCNASIDFVDIDPDTGLIDIIKLKEKLFYAKKYSQVPKVLVAVHLGGASCHMKQLSVLSKEYGFSIIEDASHALGGTYLHTQVGSCAYSDICIFSFHPVKIITTGEGGAATTNCPKLYHKMKSISTHGIVKESSRHLTPSIAGWYYEMQDLGYNYRLTDVQAALGLSQLSRLAIITQERHSIRALYCTLLDFDLFQPLVIPEYCTSANHLMIVRLLKSTPAQHIAIFNSMRSKGIGVQLHYQPVHLHPYYKSLGFSEGQFPHAEHYAQTALTLPLYPGLSHDTIRKIVTSLNDSWDEFNHF